MLITLCFCKALMNLSGIARWQPFFSKMADVGSDLYCLLSSIALSITDDLYWFIAGHVCLCLNSQSTGSKDTILDNY